MPTVVILLSDKRSGSTLVQNELCRHSAVNHVTYSPHEYSETHHWLKSAVLLQRPGALFANGRPYEGYGNRDNARAYILDTLMGNIRGYAFPEEDLSLVFEGWDLLCRQFAEPVFFEKSPQLLANWAALDLFLDWAQRTEMTVKVIGLIRNPLAVQSSAQKLFSTHPEGRQFGWLTNYRNLLAVKAVLPTECFRLVRYEDIISDPLGVFGDLCEFIGVDREPRVGEGVHVNSRNKWAEDSSFTLQLDPAVVRMARAFGYDEQELTNPNRPSEHAKRDPLPTIRRRAQLWFFRRRDRLLRPALLRLRSVFRNLR